MGAVLSQKKVKEIELYTSTTGDPLRQTFKQTNKQTAALLLPNAFAFNLALGVSTAYEYIPCNGSLKKQTNSGGY